MEKLPKRLPNQYHQEYIKEELKKISAEEITQQSLGELWYGNIELLWTANDLAKEGEIEKAMRIVESLYDAKEDDPEYVEELSRAVEKGEESHIITSVRGVIAWVLQSIILNCINKNSDPKYYTWALNIIERLAIDQNLYVRQQVTVPLELLAANIRAITHKESGEAFKFLPEDRERTEVLTFRMLQENLLWERILEYLANVFNRMRYLDEKKAMYILQTFFYSGKEMRPNYITEKMLGLAMYYAEFRESSYDKNFQSSKFKEFLKELINNANDRLKSHALWVIRQNYNKEEFDKFESYLSLFFSGDYSDSVRIQWDFLAEKVLEDDLEKGFDLLKRSLEYTKKAIEEGIDVRQSWFYYEKILSKLLEKNTDKLKEVMSDIQLLESRGIRIGDEDFLEKIRKSLEEMQQ